MTESAKVAPPTNVGDEPMDDSVVTSVAAISLIPPPPPPCEELKSADPLPPGETSEAVQTSKSPADLVTALTDVVVVSTTLICSTVI